MNRHASKAMDGILPSHRPLQKTKQPLELPLLDDVGWAIIDYLKNGRPQTLSDRVFIRHRAPYDAFTDGNCLGRMLGRHMHRAGINMTGQKQEVTQKDPLVISLTGHIVRLEEELLIAQQNLASNNPALQKKQV